MVLTINSICLLSSIMDKIKIDENFVKEMYELGKTARGKGKEYADNLQQEIGIKIVLKISSKLHLVKDELIDFIAQYKGIDKNEAEKINVIDIVKELMKDENFVSFFKQKLMPK